MATERASVSPWVPTLKLRWSSPSWMRVCVWGGYRGGTSRPPCPRRQRTTSRLTDRSRFQRRICVCNRPECTIRSSPCSLRFSICLTLSSNRSAQSIFVYKYILFRFVFHLSPNKSGFHRASNKAVDFNIVSYFVRRIVSTVIRVQFLIFVRA